MNPVATTIDASCWNRLIAKIATGVQERCSLRGSSREVGSLRKTHLNCQGVDSSGNGMQRGCVNFEEGRA